MLLQKIGRGAMMTQRFLKNKKHYFSKWEISDTAKHGFVHVRIIKGYAKLKDGMETPNFYPDLNEVKA